MIVGAASDPGAIEPPALSWIPQPFLGWQLRPGRRGGFLSQKRREAIFGDRRLSEWVRQNGIANRFGFLSSVEEYEDLSAEDDVVGLFGGSVATGFASIWRGGADGVARETVPASEGADLDRQPLVPQPTSSHSKFSRSPRCCFSGCLST